MFNLLGRIPREQFNLACSGGMDSMVVLDFLRNNKLNKFKLLYMNHGTKHGQEAEEFLKYISEKFKLDLVIGNITRDKLKEESPEEYWRNQRYEFFEKQNGSIVTAHHLNDAVETWIFSSLRGQSKLIPHIRDKYIRPFLLVSKQEFKNWAIRKDVEWIEDESNGSLDYSRNLIRHSLMPLVKQVNPDVEKMVKKKLLERFNQSKMVMDS